MVSFLHALSAWAVPMMIVLIPLYAAFRKVPVYETFIDGAKDGFQTAVGIIPHLVGMLTAISMFRASGAMDALIGTVRPLFERIGIPGDVLPLGLLRPITGAGSLAYATDLIKEHGPDSMVARIASTIQGSTDTTLYVLTVYFGAVGIRRSRYALKVGLFSDAVGFFAAVAACWLLF
ncbi:spore maturation protein [Cohnella lubricantis]|uniref:Spore maturation protein n=1 Tax=Cohnella lubricantis TaxID=2163172 RepID=A0A841TCG8_9BACL|nr:spore maturation protein [Cohnella lubricantis]MBB6677705.1 spore maturation protein [Cohnella lubricantis]MBP2117667.1 spore maturation protein B [Cohnella lubricantis]